MNKPFAQMPSLPSDVSEAFEQFKLCILRHRLGEWSDISRKDMVESLKTLIEVAKSEESAP